MPAIRPLRALVAALIALFIVASPAAAAVSQKAAGKKALSALGVKQGKQPVVVFSVKRALGGGTQLTQAGQAKPPVPGGSLGTKATTAPVLLKVPSGRRAWAFYADWAPYQAYAHRGQLAIVDAATGKVRLSSFLTSPPVIDGRLPEFMRSGKAYRSSASRIFVRDYVVDDTTALTLASRAGFGYRLDRAPFADQALAKLAADQLAADKVCALRVSDTFGDFYDFTGADNTRARLGDLLYVLRKLNPGIVDERYSRGSGKSPIEALRTLITSKGCKDVLFYVAGRGFSSGDGTTVSVGTRVRGRTVTQQLVRAADLLALVKAFPGVNFTVKVDAPHSKPFVDLLAGTANVLLAESAAGADGSSFGYLPYVKTTGGKTITNVGNPDGLLSFTNRTIAGLQRFLTNANEVNGAVGARKSGTIPSLLAVLLGRAFELGKVDDLPAAVGVQKPFFSPTPFFPSGPPPAPIVSTPPTQPNRPPVATPLTVTTAEDTAATFTIPVTDPDGDPLTVTSTVAPAHGTVTTNGLGATYTPAADYAGADQVTFTVSDGKGGSVAAVVSFTVTPVNDLPRITTTQGSAAFTEGSPAVAVDPTITVVDPDSANLTGATAVITAGSTADDELLFTPASGIAGTYDVPTRTLTLTGSASVGDYQAALRSITFRVTGANPAGGARTVSFRASDASGTGAAGIRQVTVATINDAPVLANGGAPVAYTENDAPTVIDGAYAITDPDSPSLAGATVSITAGLATAEDRLRFTNANGITGAYDVATGVLTLSGSATRADYETALRSVRYENLSDAPSTAARTITARVDDGASASNLSNTVTNTVNVTAVNDAPVVTTTASPNAGYTEDGAPVVLDAGVTVTDPDSANLSGATVAIGTGRGSTDALNFTNQNGITGSFASATGVLTLTGTATVAQYQTALRSITFSLTGDNPSTATRSIAITVRDTAPLASNTATRSLDVTAVNDAPVLGGGPLAAKVYTEDGPAVALAPTITTADPDDTNLTGATVTIGTGVQSDDALNFTNQNGITGSFSTTTHVLTLSGSATLANYQTALRSITFSTPNQDPVTAARTVSFVVDDGHAASNLSNTLSVSVTVTAVNDAPTVSTTSADLEYTEGDPATVIDGGLTVADADNANLASAVVDVSAGFVAGDTLGFVNQNGITGSFNGGTGVLTLSGTATKAQYQTALRSITYFQGGAALPTAFHTVRFVVSDGTANSAAATRRVHFNTVNSSPTVTTSGGTTAITEGSAGGAIDGAVTVADPDDTNLAGAQAAITAGFVAGDDLQFTNQNGITGSYASATGVLTLSGTATVAQYQTALRSIKFVNAGPLVASGSRTVRFTVSDPSNASGTATKGISFTAVDNAPTVTTSAGSSTWTQADVTPVAVDPGVTTTDPDSTNLTQAEVSITDAKAGDRLTLDPGATVPGTVTTSGSGTTTFTFSGAATVASYQALLRAVRFDSSSLTPTNADRHVSFKVKDATTTTTASTNRTVKVVPDNATPVAVADAFTTDEDTSFADDVRQNDTDGNDATNTLQVDEVAGSAANVGVQQTLASGATVTIDVNGAIAYDPNGAFEGLQTGQTATDTVTYRVKDPAGATSNTATVTITINGVNDAPQAVARRFNAVRQTALEVEPGATAISAPRVRVAGSLLTGATDVDDPAANADLVDETISTPHGTVDLDPDGSFVYTSAAGDSATTDTFSFKIKDTHNAQSTQTVTIDLQGGVYYVDNDNNGAADGTSTKPFKTVQLATAAAGTGDTIHVGASAGTTTSAATLKNNQVIVGAGKALTANLTGGGENTGATTLVAAGTAPTLGTTSGAVLTLASGNTVDSVDIDPDTTAKGIVAASAGAVTLKDVTVVDAGTASTGAAIDLTGANASASLQNVDITTQSATGLKLTNSAISADTASTIAATGGPAVDSSGATGGTLSFGTVSSTNSSGTGISLGGAAAFSATGGSLTGSAGIGFDLNGGAASVSYPGAISPAPGAGVVRVQNRTGATATLSGNLTSTGNSPAITVSGNTGGTTVFSGSTKALTSGTANAVSLTSNTGATVQFQGGGLAASSSSGDAFRATGGGTVSVAGSNNVLTAGANGAALNAQNVSAALIFQTINAAGSARGIFLDTVSGAAPLTVTGDATTTRNSSGGTIATTTGADAATAGNGVYVKDTGNVSLEQLAVTNAQNHGLLATGAVGGLSFQHGTISGSGTADATTSDKEGNVRLNAITGTVSFDDVALSSPKTNDVWITHNTGAATVNITGGSTLSVNPGVTGTQNAGVIADGGAAGTLTTNITNSTVQGDATNGAAGPLVDLSPTGGSNAVTWTTNLTGSTFTSPQGSAGAEDVGGQVRFRAQGFNGNLNTTVSGGTFRGAVPSMLQFLQGAGTSQMTTTVNNATIGTAGTERSASNAGSGIAVDSGGTGAGQKATITNNTINGYASDTGVFLTSAQGGAGSNAPLSATVTGNTIGTPYTAAGNQSFAGIYASFGVTSGQTGTSCLDLSSNTIAAFGAYVAPIYVEAFQNVVVQLPSYGGGATNTGAVQSYLDGRNPAASGSFVDIGGGAAYTNRAGSCP